MKAVRRVIASKGVPYLQMRLVGSHSMSGREKEGNKERTGPYMLSCCAWSNGLQPKKLLANVAVPPAPVRTSQRSFDPSVTSVG
jgi:hypothetical protein